MKISQSLIEPLLGQKDINFPHLDHGLTFFKKKENKRKLAYYLRLDLK